MYGIIFSLPSTSSFVYAEHHDDHDHHHEEHDDLWGDHDDDEEEHHGHIGEHGGQFGDASDMYHYEVLLNDDKDIIVYMYDGKARRIKDITSMEVRWTLNPNSEYPLKGVLKLSRDNGYFILDLPEISSKYVEVKIEAEKDGKWWPVEFLLEVK